MARTAAHQDDYNRLAGLPRPQQQHTTACGHSRNLSYSGIVAREIGLSLAAPIQPMQPRPKPPQPPPRLLSQTAAAAPPPPPPSKAPSPAPMSRPLSPLPLSPTYSSIIATEIALSLRAAPPIYLYPALHQNPSPGAIGDWAPLLEGGEAVYPLVPGAVRWEKGGGDRGEGEEEEGGVIFHCDTGTFEVLRHGRRHMATVPLAATGQPPARVMETERRRNVSGEDDLRAPGAQELQQRHTDPPPSPPPLSPPPPPSPRKHLRRVSKLIAWGREVSSRKERRESRRRRSVV